MHAYGVGATQRHGTHKTATNTRRVQRTHNTTTKWAQQTETIVFPKDKSGMTWTLIKTDNKKPKTRCLETAQPNNDRLVKTFAPHGTSQKHAQTCEWEEIFGLPCLWMFVLPHVVNTDDFVSNTLNSSNMNNNFQAIRNMSAMQRNCSICHRCGANLLRFDWKSAQTWWCLSKT